MTEKFNKRKITWKRKFSHEEPEAKVFVKFKTQGLEQVRSGAD